MYVRGTSIAFLKSAGKTFQKLVDYGANLKIVVIIGVALKQNCKSTKTKLHNK